MQSDSLYNLSGEGDARDSLNDFDGDDDVANINGVPMNSDDILGGTY